MYLHHHHKWSMNHSWNTKSLYKSRAGSHFYGTEYIWALGWFWVSWQYWELNFGPIVSNFWGCFFHVFRGKKGFFFSNIVASNIVASVLKSEKLHNISFIIKKIEVCFDYFLATNRLNIHNAETILLIRLFFGRKKW